MNAVKQAVYEKDPTGSGVPMKFTEGELNAIVEAAVADALLQERMDRNFS